MKRQFARSIVGIVVVLALNGLSSLYYYRLDLTEDKRYTLSQAAVSTVDDFDAPVIIDVLLDGPLPSEFTRLRSETVLLLEQFRSKNSKIQVNLINPLEEPQEREQTIFDLQQLGLKPATVTIEDEGRTTQELIFPWAMVNHKNKTVKVPLLKNTLGASQEERINNSVQNLEYAFSDAFVKLQLQEKKKIAVLKGNGELEDRYLADFLSTIREYYNIGAITLDQVAEQPNKVLEQLNNFDMALVAKPTEAFTEAEKYVLDQYILYGGKSLWLLDQVAIELDSLFNEKGAAVAIPRDLNLNDFFFKHGIRINPVLLNDLYNTPIVLATGEASTAEYNPLPWVYYPMVFSKENHPVNTNIEAIQIRFGNVIDTLASLNKKTVVLQSSPFSKKEGTPKSIGLEMLQTFPSQRDYEPGGGFPIAVAIEGDFTSVYTNRIKPILLKNAKEKGVANK
ncbi:MAG: gliding motility-associated ABC transporter substrate-binding protein GldG [Bacteroidota bacterium]